MPPCQFRALAVLPAAGATGQQHQLASPPCRELRHQAGGPVVFTYRAALSPCDGPAAAAGIASLARDAAPCLRAGCVHLRRSPPVRGCTISLGRCGAVPSHRRCSPSVLPSACATGPQRQQAQRLIRAMRSLAIAPDLFTHSAALSLCDGPAAPAGMTCPASAAEPCHRAGCVHR